MTYSLLTQGLCNVGRRKEAISLLAEMVDFDVHPKVIGSAYTILVD